MAHVSSSEVRSRAATACDAVTGWRESPWAPGLFGRDPRPDMHKTFAVALPAASVPLTQRQSLTEGAYVVTAVEVSWAYQLRADGQVLDHGLALDAEALLIKALAAASKTSGVQWLLDGASRNTTTEGWMLGVLRFRAIHRIALS
jgi:hypothetical protein